MDKHSHNKRQASPIPDIAKVTYYEVIAALKAGIWDFRRAPAFGLAFAAFTPVAWVVDS